MDRAIFLDRDGVINPLLFYKEAGVLDSPFKEKDFKLLPNVAKAIKIINKLGFLAIVVSNQPGVAKGKCTTSGMDKINDKLSKLIGRQGAFVDAIYYCYHHPQGKVKKLKKICSCRKPKPGLLKKASKDFGINLKKSYMIGDSITDVLAGKAVGCKTFLIGDLKCDLCNLIERRQAKPNYIVSNLYKAIKIIKKLEE